MNEWVFESLTNKFCLRPNSFRAQYFVLRSSLNENVPDSDESIFASANDLTIVSRKVHGSDGTRVSLAFSDEVALAKVIEANYTRLATDSKVLVRMTDGD